MDLADRWGQGLPRSVERVDTFSMGKLTTVTVVTTNFDWKRWHSNQPDGFRISIRVTCPRGVSLHITRVGSNPWALARNQTETLDRTAIPIYHGFRLPFGFLEGVKQVTTSRPI